jgi:hypothetical protein
MSRYDRSWNRTYDRGYRPRPVRDYGSDFGGRGGAWQGWPSAAPWRGSGFGGGPGGPPRPRGQRARYDRGEYGDMYPGYGGYPGDRARGMYYGGRPFGPMRAPRGGNWGEARGYDRGIAPEPFLPEAAYQRHPELEEPQRHPLDEWPGEGQVEYGLELSEEEIRSAVRQNLFNDHWIDADRIQVTVSEQVVTLTGEVDDYLEARYAWDDAWEAAGVRGVINQLTVRTETAPAESPKSPARKGAK